MRRRRPGSSLISIEGAQPSCFSLEQRTHSALGPTVKSSKPDDAITLLKLNLEYYPKSAKTLAAIGYAYTRKYDDASAIKYLEQAVELDPNNGVIGGQLVQLKTYQRRK